MRNIETYRFGPSKVSDDFEQINLPLKSLAFPSETFTLETPLVSDGMIFVATNGLKLLAFAELDFSLIWEVRFPDQRAEFSSPLEFFILEGRLVCFLEETAFVVDKISGKVIHQFPFQGTGRSLFVAFPNYHRFIALVFTESLESQSQWIDTQSWEIFGKAAPYSAYSGTDDFAFLVGESQDHIVCIAAESCEVKWELKITESLEKAGWTTLEFDSLKVAGEILIYRHLLIVAVGRSSIMAVDMHSRKAVWATKTEMKFMQTVGLGPDGNLHAFSPDHYCKIDTLTGELLLQRALGDSLHRHGVYHGISPVTFSATHAFFSDGDGNIIAFNLQTLEVDWSYHTNEGIPNQCFPIIANGRLYTVDLNGELYIFESGVG